MSRSRLARGLGVGLVAAAIAGALLAPVASAHNGAITISCTNVTFSYTGFPSGTNPISETVKIDNSTVVSKTFTFSGSSGTDSVSINPGPGTHTVNAHASWTVGGGGSADKTQTVSGCAPPCPNGIQPHFRWHYAGQPSNGNGNFTSGSWSATTAQNCPGSFSMGPQSMEGDLKVAPGSTLKAGYDFTFPGNNKSFSITVNDPKVVFTVRCVSGATPSASTFTVTMPTKTYSVTNQDWLPSGDQSSPLVYEGSIKVPDLCGGGDVRLDKGGTFSATLS